MYPNHTHFPVLIFLFLFFGFSRQGFAVVLEPVLELTLVDQAGLKLTDICLPLLGLKACAIFNEMESYNL